MGMIRNFEDFYGDRILAAMAQRGDYRPLLRARSIEEARRIAIEERRRDRENIVVSDNVVPFPLV